MLPSVCGRAIALKNISAEITATINRLIWRSKCEVTTNPNMEKLVGIGIGNSASLKVVKFRDIDFAVSSQSC